MLYGGLAATALACSTFATHTREGTLFGRNTDGEMAIVGQLLVNKRGVEKSSVPWVFAGPGASDQQRVQWVSSYGSLTFTHFGREFPDGGVNEAGLIVEEMTLGGAEYSNNASRPSISVQQWIQYQLDNFASVDEVLDHVDDFNLRGWPWHFSVADQQGNCAVLEFIGGALKASRGFLGNGCILTNHSLSEALFELGQAQSNPEFLQGHEPFSSTARFVTASQTLDEGAPQGFNARRDYAFGLLESIAQGDNTFRSIVYDLGAGLVYFRTVDEPGIKSVALGELDFSASTPVLALALDTPGSGDVTAQLGPYDPQANLQTVEAVFELIRATPGVSEQLDLELVEAGLDERDFIRVIASYPESTTLSEVSH